MEEKSQSFRNCEACRQHQERYTYYYYTWLIDSNNNHLHIFISWLCHKKLDAKEKTVALQKGQTYTFDKQPNQNNVMPLPF